MNQQWQPSSARLLRRPRWLVPPAPCFGTINTFEAFPLYGHQSYGERVSMQEHMLQTAYFAEQDGAGPLLIAAALLHDYGHLIHNLPEDIADQSIDIVHEQVGADYLAEYFIPAITEPGRLHVAAERYLYAVDPIIFPP